MLVEVCLDSAESALAAQQGGADRVELCDNLIEGGTTPSAGMIDATRRHIDVGLQVMIRPRGGDFFYTAVELDAMAFDIAECKRLGADGVVFGMLNPDGTIDAAATKRLLDAARPMNVTFHRAFDMTRDPFEALETLVALGVDRVLTSGQECTVMEGLDLITDLVQAAGDRIVVMPGCGINARNVRKVVAACRAHEIHVVGTKPIESSMRHRNEHVSMGTELRAPEYVRTVTSAAAVRRILDAFG